MKATSLYIIFMLFFLTSGTILIGTEHRVKTTNCLTYRTYENLILDYAPAPPVPEDPRYRYRPIIGGLRMEFYYPENPPYLWSRWACTIGVPAYYRTCDHCPAFWGFITAGHCLVRKDLSVYQNDSRVSEDLIGYTRLSSTYIDRRTDSAFVIIEITDNENIWPSAERLLPRIWHQGSYVFITDVLTDPWNTINQKVYITGQSSQTIEALIELVDFMCIEHEDGSIWCGLYMVLDSEAPFLGGDSGAPVYRTIGGPYAQIYGIMSAHDRQDQYTGYANFIGDILEWLPQSEDQQGSLNVFVCPNPYGNPC